MHDSPRNLKRQAITLAVSIGTATLTVGISIAFASLVFNGTSITGDSSSTVDATGTITIGGAQATGVTIGRTGQTVTFPGTITNANVTSSLWYGTSTGTVAPLLLGTNLSITNSTLNASASGGSSSTDAINYLAPASGSVSRTLTSKLSDTLNVKDFGATGNAQVVSDAAITAGTNTLNSNSATFTPSDVGKLFDVNGAGVSSCGQQYWGVGGVNMNCNLVGTITGYVDSHDVTLSVNAGTSVSGAKFKWGTDDTNAIKAAFAALVSSSSYGKLYFPTGNYSISATLQNTLVNKTIYGDGREASNIWQMGVVAYTPATFYVAVTFDNGSANVLVEHIGAEGTDALGELGRALGGANNALWEVCSGAPNGLGGVCNSQSGISGITYFDVRADNEWGGGFAVPGTSATVGQQVQNVSYVSSYADTNGWDGFNPNAYNVELIGDRSIGNGTGGAEIAAVGTANVEGGDYNSNKLVGVAIGGLVGTRTGLAAKVIGINANNNGVCGASTTQGIGIEVAINQLDADIANNVVDQNCLVGISVLGGSFSNYGKIHDNTIVSNGQNPDHSGTVAAGILVSGPNYDISNNDIRDDGISGFLTTWGIELGSGTSGTTMFGRNNISGASMQHQYEIGSNVTCSYFDPTPGYSIQNLSSSTCPTNFLNGIGALSTSLGNGSILVGNASSVAAAVSPSGDVSVSSTGKFTVNTVNGGLSPLTVANAQVLTYGPANCGSPCTVTHVSINSSASTTMTTAPSGGACYEYFANISQVDTGSGCTGTGSVGPGLTFTDEDSGVVNTTVATQGYTAGGSTLLGTVTLGSSTIGSANIVHLVPFAFCAASGTVVKFLASYTAGTGCTTGQDYSFHPFLYRTY